MGILFDRNTVWRIHYIMEVLFEGYIYCLMGIPFDEKSHKKKTLFMCVEEARE